MAIILMCNFNPSMFHDPNQWAVYTHTLPADESPAWVGWCRSGQVLQCPDAYDSHMWRADVLPAPMVRLDVLGHYPTENEALRACMGLVRLHRPRINLLTGSTAVGGVSKRVKCVETGEIYDSIRLAANAHGLYESQLSVYLNRRVAGKLRGLTFVKV